MIDYTKVKLVVTDMDGTLLHSDYSLNPEFFDIYQQLKKLNIKFSVASGRQYDSLLNIFESIKDEIYFIAENGGNVVYQGKHLFVQQIGADVIGEVVKICRTLSGTETLLCGLKNAYVEKSAPEFAEHIAPYYPKNKTVPDLLEEIDDQIVKIAIYNALGSEKNVYPHFKFLEEQYNVKISGKHWLDISIKQSDKGIALKEVQDILHISAEETMVFGDYLNDLEMIRDGYFSFAMENAHPILKETARYQAESNDKDGVLKVLKEMIRQKNEIIAL